MTLSQLIDDFRLRTDDRRAPYLWGDDEITLYLNEAITEAATRALLIQDTLEIDIDRADSVYELDAEVLDIVSAKLSDYTELDIKSREYLDSVWSNWEIATGDPRYLFENGDGNITVVPRPVSADTVTLIVKRLPSEPLVDDDDVPEIPAKHHYRLMDWALRCGYLKHDAETYDPVLAEKHEAAFIRSFGIYEDANVQRKQRDKRPTTTKSSW
jgi:hypothetical protein